VPLPRKKMEGIGHRYRGKREKVRVMVLRGERDRDRIIRVMRMMALVVVITVRLRGRLLVRVVIAPILLGVGVIPVVVAEDPTRVVVSIRRGRQIGYGGGVRTRPIGMLVEEVETELYRLVLASPSPMITSRRRMWMIQKNARTKTIATN